MSHDLLAADTLFWASLKIEGIYFHLFQLKVLKVSLVIKIHFALILYACKIPEAWLDSTELF